MDILIIIAAIAFIVFAAKVLLGRSRKQAMSSNPVDGICFNGIMGFMLGDSYEFCLSRLRHLDLLVNNDDLSNGYYSGVVSWGKNTFNNVNEVRFVFDNKKLTSIVIDIDFSKDGITDMYGILVSRICRILGTEPIFSDAKQTAWASVKTKSGILLSRHLMPVIEEENLLIHIGSI